MPFPVQSSYQEPLTVRFDLGERNLIFGARGDDAVNSRQKQRWSFMGFLCVCVRRVMNIVD